MMVNNNNPFYLYPFLSAQLFSCWKYILFIHYFFLIWLSYIRFHIFHNAFFSFHLYSLLANPWIGSLPNAMIVAKSLGVVSIHLFSIYLFTYICFNIYFLGYFYFL